MIQFIKIPGPRLDENAARRIVKAMGLTGLKTPNWSEFCRDLNHAVKHMKFDTIARNDPRLSKATERKRAKRLKQVFECAIQLRDLLTMRRDDDIEKHYLETCLQMLPYNDNRHDPFEAMMSYLHWLCHSLAPLRNLYSKNRKKSPIDRRQPSAKALLIVHGLGTCSRNHLGLEARRSYTKGGKKASGSFIAFVQAVEKEAGLPVTPAESIATYITRYNNNIRGVMKRFYAPPP
jgi:hypothetical protein